MPDHEWVIGELAVGNLPERTTKLELLRNLPQAPLVTGYVRAVGQDATDPWQAWGPCPTRPASPVPMS